MINSNWKNENEFITLKTTSTEKNQKITKSYNCNVVIIIFAISFFISIITSFLLYQNVRNLKVKIMNKDIEIEKQRNIINNLKMKIFIPTKKEIPNILMYN